jgi:tRNA(Ile)-lysidine synthase
VAAARRAVRAELADLAPGALVLVACSGGPDSLALAAATAFVAPRAGLRAGAIVVDHGWFAGSAQVARAAVAACRELGLDPVQSRRASRRPSRSGPEAGARSARYAVLDEVAERSGAAVVLLGHTQDDQAETVLLGLVRGSGTRSLAGMPARRGRYRRPLLGLPRAITRQVCSVLGLEPWTDPANIDPAFTRSRVRALLPELDAALGPGLVAALARTATLAGEDAAALDRYTDQVVQQAAVAAGPVGDPNTVVRVDVATLAASVDAVRRRALLAAARRAGCPAGSLSRRHALALDALVVRWRGQGPVHLPGGVVAIRSCGTLELAAAQGRRPEHRPDQE